MTKIAIIADTDASLPDNLAQQLGIYTVPISIHFGQDTYDSGVTIDDTALFERIDREGQLPTTSAPTPGKFSQAYRQAIEDGADTIICFCVSTEVSATHQSAVVAAEDFPDVDITVVDTLQISMPQGYMAIAAAEAAQAGASKEKVLAAADSIAQRTDLYAALSTVKYLAMGGRLTGLAAGMATMLSIKPILTVRDGKLDLLEKIRTTKKARARVIELAKESLGGATPERMAILNVAAQEAAEAFREQLREALPCPSEIPICDLSPGLSVHSGSGLVGVAFVKPEA